MNKPLSVITFISIGIVILIVGIWFAIYYFGNKQYNETKQKLKKEYNIDEIK